MIKHIHLDQCDSTQNVLKEQLRRDHFREFVLVSCEHQSSGRGRGENKWVQLPGSLCFSMSLKAHKIPSFTALEISVIIADFFIRNGRKLHLKWPNDLYEMNLKKCGGILIQMDRERLLVGIGLNFFSSDERFGGIWDKEFEFTKSDWSKKIALFILENRLSDTEDLKKKWWNLCCHQNKHVLIQDGVHKSEGIFQGIGEYGEALVREEDTVRKIFNGSLRFQDSGSFKT